MQTQLHKQKECCIIINNNELILSISQTRIYEDFLFSYKGVMRSRPLLKNLGLQFFSPANALFDVICSRPVRAVHAVQNSRNLAGRASAYITYHAYCQNLNEQIMQTHLILSKCIALRQQDLDSSKREIDEDPGLQSMTQWQTENAIY